MRVNLILPTFNNSHLTIKCLESIKKYNDKDFNINIIWVDNNSLLNDRIIVNNFLVKNNISFDKIFLSNNLGFIKAVNIGLKYALKKYQRNKFIGIINNDIEVSKDWLKNLIHCFENDKSIMCVGSISYNSNLNKIDLLDVNLNDEIKSLTGKSFDTICKELNYLRNNYKIFDISSFNDYKHAIIPYFSVIFKTAIFKEIGLLNENFNMGYSDDTEFNYRICQAGYKIAKSFKSCVLHNSRSTFKLINNNDNSIINRIQKGNIQQLEISKILNPDKIKKYVIYTCISGNYDKLKSPNKIDTNLFDYVCFTNSEKISKEECYPWKIFYIKDIENSLNLNDPDPKDKQVKFARYIKTHPHLFFENYEYSIWIDANVNILGNSEEYVKLLTDDHFILTQDHPRRKCIYNEVAACKQINKDTHEKLNMVNKFLLNENYPKDNGLIQSNILLRKHNDERCKFFMEKWWECIRDYSRRDQLSFNYVFWKYNGKYLSLPYNLIKTTYFNTDYKHIG